MSSDEEDFNLEYGINDDFAKSFGIQDNDEQGYLISLLVLILMNQFLKYSFLN